jgi:hypothetical protein
LLQSYSKYLSLTELSKLGACYNYINVEQKRFILILMENILFIQEYGMSSLPNCSSQISMKECEMFQIVL